MIVNVSRRNEVAERVAKLGIHVIDGQRIEADWKQEISQGEIIDALLRPVADEIMVWAWAPDDSQPYGDGKVYYRYHHLLIFPDQNGSPQKYLLVQKDEVQRDGERANEYRGWWVGCDHDWERTASGRTYHTSRCKKCGASYTLDHGD